MLFAPSHAKRVYPFADPDVQYVHLARNAIYLLAQQMGLSGKEVLVPAFFHGVELEALMAAGVRPRFFPVRDGMRVDTDDILRCLTPDTRAVYLIHYLGFAGPVEAVQQICRERGLLFIEDCALALLSRIGETPLGTFGDASVFCIYKTIPTPDGGAVVVKDRRLTIGGVRSNFAATARETAVSILRRYDQRGSRFGKSVVRAVATVGKAVASPRPRRWVEIGTQNFDVAEANLVMSSISHRIIATQDFDAVIAARRRNYLHLESLLRDLSRPLFPSLFQGVCPLFYPFVTERKHELWAWLQANGVQSVLFWLPGGLGPAPGEFPESDALRRTVLELPCHQDMTPEGIERMARLVRKGVQDMNR
jgi:dTDP-4-amino-4,6-dideoxygalactose transaminase